MAYPPFQLVPLFQSTDLQRPSQQTDYELCKFDPDRQLYAPYLARENGELTSSRFEDNYDSTDPSQEW